MIKENIYTPSFNEKYYKRYESLSGTSISPLKNLTNSLKNMSRTILSAISGTFNTFMQRSTASHHNTVVKIDHLHHSCKKLNDHNKKVFYLYVKGYSIPEISALSGKENNTIITIVYHIAKRLKHYSHLS